MDPKKSVSVPHVEKGTSRTSETRIHAMLALLGSTKQTRRRQVAVFVRQATSRILWQRLGANPAIQALLRATKAAALAKIAPLATSVRTRPKQRTRTFVAQAPIPVRGQALVPLARGERHQELEQALVFSCPLLSASAIISPLRLVSATTKKTRKRERERTNHTQPVSP